MQLWYTPFFFPGCPCTSFNIWEKRPLEYMEMSLPSVRRLRRRKLRHFTCSNFITQAFSLGEFLNFFMGFLTVHLAGVCCDFLPLSVNLLIPVPRLYQMKILPNLPMWCRNSVWSGLTDLCSEQKGVEQSHSLSFLNRIVTTLEVLGRDLLWVFLYASNQPFFVLLILQHPLSWWFVEVSDFDLVFQ